MPNNNWTEKAHSFLKSDIAKARISTNENGLRIAIMDSHAVLENSMRGYLVGEYDMQEVSEKSNFNFPRLTQIIREKTGDSIIASAEHQAVLSFNGLRNRVVHDAYHPNEEETKSGVRLVSRIVQRLINSKQSLPDWQQPFEWIAGQLGSGLTSGLGTAMFIFTILYILNPLDIPGPVDDLAVSAPCLITAFLLVNAARWIKNKSSRRK